MIPKLSENNATTTTMMLEIGDDGQLMKEGEASSARGAKREASSASISTPATQDSSNKNQDAARTFDYPQEGAQVSGYYRHIFRLL